MPYLIVAFDHSDKDIERESIRGAHRKHLVSAGERLLASGAFLAKDGKTVIGGASLLDTEDESEARAFESEDPYARAGIRKDVMIIPWRVRWWRGEFNADGWGSKAEPVEE